MYLKRLELCGFKSFADKTKLNFEQGITAIIGPNGCGKSNTADAIRWCLGEQSARSLRSHQMMDVIFGGSQSRQTTGMAEVSLTFDNSQNMLPIDYSEVTVTRRIFRSGESEYFMNKVQCRLKDIRDLFLDTGIGTEGYAIIEQGKVEFLLQAKPDERREMFEEAAGVSKYKVRREETLRKLEKVDVDMNRINDMLALLKEQINSLDIAAKKARQYQKYKDDLRRLEITALVHSILQSVRDIERVKSEFDPRSKEFETFNTGLDSLEADIAQLRLEQTEKDELYVRLQDEFSQIRSGINLSDERVRQAALREEELSERHTLLLDETAANSDRMKQYAGELAQVRALWQTLTEQAAKHEQEYKDKEDQIQLTRAKIAGCQQQEASLRARLFDTATGKTNHHNEQNRLTSNQAHCQARVLSLQKELNRLKEQRAPLEAEIASKETEKGALAGKISEIQSKQEELDRQLRELEQRSAENQSRRTSVKEKLVSLESKRQTLQEWEAKDPVRSTMRTVMSLDIASIRGPVSSMMRIDPGMQETVAAALGEKLNYMVSETAEAAQRAIRHLEENGLGRLSFVVMERLPENLPSAPLAELPGARPLISLLQCEPGMEKLTRFLCGETLVHGQSIYGHAVIQGGGKISFDKPVLVEDQIRRLTEEFEDNRKELSAAEEAGALIQDDLQQTRDEKKATDLEYQKAGVELAWLEKHLTSVKEELAYRDREIALSLSDIQAQDQEEKQIKEQLAAIETGLAALEGEEQKAREQLQLSEAEIRGHREEENRLAPLLTEAKVAWATQCNELSGREREAQKLDESLAALKAQSVQAEQELSTLAAKTAEQKTIQQAESGKLKQLHQELSQKEVEVQKSLAERQEIGRSLDTRNESLHTTRQQVEALKQDIYDLQLEQRSFELQKQGMEQRLREDFTATLDEVKVEYGKLTFSDDEIARLKRRLESMGAVNLAAPEEYANIEERYNFLLTQQQDLLKAKEDLHQVITKINQNTRENFKKTFDQVRENFRSIYRQLFEGGEADLTLTDESNLLECGVDILAQPPGKKLQNIALLSGGEKALTAIALLFAFFMVRP
ncbi:MAG: chromosome segregation protein SMC, partial [Endomicrobiales bacterium]